MKKLITILTLTFILIMGTSIAANAEELTEGRGSRIAEQKAARETKAAEMEARQEANEAKRLEQQAKRLTILDDVAPNWVDDFTIAFDEHNAVHVLLDQAITLWKDTTIAELQANSEAYKAEIKAQVDDEEITSEEARELLTAYREEVKAANQVLRTEFQAEVEEIKTDLGLSQEIAEALRADFKAAVESQDQEAIDSAVSAMFDYLLDHIEFDYQKLDLINSQSLTELSL